MHRAELQKHFISQMGQALLLQPNILITKNKKEKPAIQIVWPFLYSPATAGLFYGRRIISKHHRVVIQNSNSSTNLF
jgi:hypothetical protein